MKNKKGFTLIELLAVIIILGILMIIAIPSVTSYINNSRKSAYVDTAKEIISGARNFVNEGKLEMFDTGTTYYIPVSCITTENGQKSPYGDFVEDQAFVIVTYTGKNYNYFWISRDTTGQGVKTITPVGELDEDDIKSDISASEITPTEPAETGKTTIKVLSKDDCKTFGSGSGGSSSPTASTQLKIDAESDLYNILETDIYIFRGGNPSNYVKFNCDDNGQNCETWRIVGIYGDKLKMQITIALTNQKYNNSTSDGNAWEGSRLETYLNQETDGGYYYDLKQTAKDLITEGTWYVGEGNANDNAIESYANAIMTPINKKVGIIAIYEFLYASDGDNCSTTAGNYGNFNIMCGTLEHDWLKPNKGVWSISPRNSVGNNSVIAIESDGRTCGYDVNISKTIYPTVFLDSTVKIVSGTGVDAENAYVLSK